MCATSNSNQLAVLANSNQDFLIASLIRFCSWQTILFGSD